MLLARRSRWSCQAVEVSGWDSAQRFFVEKAEVATSEEDGMRLAMSRKVADRTIVFIRLLRPMEDEQTHPAVYQAEYLHRSRTGQYLFAVELAEPRLKTVLVEKWNSVPN